MIPAMRVYFARHGESEANLHRVVANRGWSYPLTERGRGQAARLAGFVRADLVACGLMPAHLDGRAWVRIVSSPLRRAAETASVLHAALDGGTLELADSLREADCGVMEGRSDEAAWAAHDDVESRWLRGDRAARIEGGESLDDLLERFMPWLRSTLDRAGPTDALVAVGHGSLYRFVLPEAIQDADGGRIAVAAELGQAEALVVEVPPVGTPVAVGTLATGGR